MQGGSIGEVAPATAGGLRTVLISTYELGRQPFGLASPAGWLREAGIPVTCIDLAVESLDDEAVCSADLIGFYLPMHTATRIAVPLIRRVQAMNPGAHVCAYGLYAPGNDKLLRGLGVDTVIGGEFEEPLLALAQRLRAEKAGMAAGPSQWRVVSLARQRFKVPDRSGLPPLRSYARLRLPTGEDRTVGYTEATRGCKHLCRHCPIVPVYQGRFRVVQRDVVLEDVGHQVEAGARHITFGDPDFFNAPAHATATVEALHEAFPDLTYDVTIKVEHLVRHARHLPTLRDTGCLFVTTAVESFDQRVLELFDKRHSKDDFATVVRLFRDLGLTLNPTFVAFTPWTTVAGYLEFLATIHDFRLVANVAPVQYAIRLLIPAESKLLELVEVRDLVGPFDEVALCYPWRHPDPRVDLLQQELFDLVKTSLADRGSRQAIFHKVWDRAAGHAVEQTVRRLELDRGRPRELVPYLTEPWYC
jgi:radical SAM superfamily enzyme YgiQ (UPF0313 family)